MKEHEEDSAVHALKRELEADTYEIHVTEENSDYEADGEDETDNEVCQVRETRAEQMEIRRAVQSHCRRKQANKLRKRTKTWMHSERCSRTTQQQAAMSWQQSLNNQCQL